MEKEIEHLKARISELEEELSRVRSAAERDINHRMALTINNIPLAIVNTDKHGYINAVNPAFLRIFAVTSGELIDKQNIRYFEPFVQNPIHPYVDELVEKSIEFDIEIPFRLKDKDVFFRCRGIKISSQLSEESSFLFIIGDITRRKTTEQELLKALQRAEESDRLKTAFLAAMSHEIRTPMNHIIGFSEFLKDPLLNADEREEYCQIIYESGQCLLRLIEDIIDIARLESHQMLVNPTVFGVDDFIRSIYRSFAELRAKNTKNQISFLLKCPENAAKIYIKTDAIRLQQIVDNLLDNAFKFTSHGQVELGYAVQDGKLAIYVRDTGPGIPADKHEWVFKRFRQLDYSINKKYGGTGLGLALVKSLAELLEGEVKLESEVGKGALFTVLIPGIIMQQTHKNGNNNGVSRIDWSGFTFLVVEDERSNYNLLSIMLRPSKVKLIWAKDGHEAMALFGQYKNDIHLVLMDIRLPGINGYEVTKHIKTIRPELPVIAQTAYAMEIEIIKAREAGCDDYISKPIDRRLLLDMISRHLPEQQSE
ncbi:MAG TPA: ATP-binding protein [Bacteroidales bacterium]|nr:ATP-binding protein [Bacteroidales bacterium]